MEKIIICFILAAPVFLLGWTRESRPSFVHLNHFYLVLDPATYSAIEDSQFLRTEFAPYEKRTTVRADRTYTGVYFYGANTYFEFFDAGHENRPLHESAIAFGVDQPGQVQSLLAGHSAEFAALPATITRELNGVQVPWFYLLAPKDLAGAPGFQSWIMEYHPRFLAEWHAEAGGASQEISRARILQRYKAVLKGVPARPYLQDVIAITLATGPAVAESLARLCQQWGYQVSKVGDATVLEGPDISLRLVPETASAKGITKVTFKVQGTPGRQSGAPGGKTEFRFGQSALAFGGDGTATWSF